MKETKVYSLGLKGDAAQADVYAIDLNDLKRVLQEAGGQGDLCCYDWCFVELSG